MSDWAISTWWGNGPIPRLPARLGDDDGWAARLGRVGDRGLWQMDVLSRYAYRSPPLKTHPQVLAVTPEDIITEGHGPLVAGFNYLMSWPHDRPVRWLSEAAALLADATATETAGQSMLCLPRPVIMSHPHVVWQVDAPGSSAALDLCAALAISAPRRSGGDFLVGLWTTEYGYLHTGRLQLFAAQHPYEQGTVEVQLTGVFQQLDQETRTGRYMDSNYFLFDPVPPPTVQFR